MKIYIKFLMFFLIVTHINSNLLSFKVHNYKNNLFSTYSYDPSKNGECGLLDFVIQPGMVVFDIGANQGDYTDYVLSLKRNVTVYAFEPILNLYDGLLNKFKFNDLVKLYRLGLFSKNIENGSIYSNGALSSVYDRSQTCGQAVFSNKDLQVIDLVSLDHFCKCNNVHYIDFLKLDVEGAEYDVLLGASSMLANKKIKHIQFEYGGTYIDAGYKLKQVYDYLHNQGYFIYKIVNDGAALINEWSDGLEDFKYSNFFASIDEL